jgi:hypothetical protein
MKGARQFPEHFMQTQCNIGPMSRIFFGIVVACFSLAVTGQRALGGTQGAPAEIKEVDVPIVDKLDSRQLDSGYCGWRSDEPGPVIGEEEFRKLIGTDSRASSRLTRDRCAFLKRLKLDFSRHSLLNYRVNGDCFIRATAKVTRNDAHKEYTLWITRIYGGCRAAGSFEGWLVIDKLLPDYKVESVVFERDESARPRILERGAVNR